MGEGESLPFRPLSVYRAKLSPLIPVLGKMGEKGTEILHPQTLIVSGKFEKHIISSNCLVFYQKNWALSWCLPTEFVFVVSFSLPVFSPSLVTSYSYSFLCILSYFFPYVH